MIVLMITLIPTIRYYKELDKFFKSRNGEIIEDERTQYIDERASLPAFGSVMGIIIYAAIAIFTLRNIYPTTYFNVIYILFYANYRNYNIFNK